MRGPSGRNRSTARDSKGPRIIQKVCHMAVCSGYWQRASRTPNHLLSHPQLDEVPLDLVVAKSEDWSQA